MKRMIAALLASVALPAVGQAPQVVREWNAQVALDVDRTGQVVQAVLPDRFPEAVTRPAREVMAHWRFKPAMSRGHAAGARTYAVVKLQVVTRDAGQFGLRVLYTANGPRLHPTVAPIPPIREVNSAQGDMLVEAVVRPDGHIDHVQVVESHFNSHTHLFKEAASQAISQWRADPEYVDGHPVATRVQIPITLCHGKDGKCEQPQPELKLWRRPTAGPAMAAPASGQAVALDSPLEPLSMQSGG
jgi:TonB family protein